MRLVKSGLITIVTGVVTAFSAVSSASDEYRLSAFADVSGYCLLYTSPSPRDKRQSRMPSSA